MAGLGFLLSVSYYSLVKTVTLLIQAVYYRLNGVQKLRTRLLAGEASETPVEVFHITHKAPWKPFTSNEHLFFNTWHEDFVPLTYLHKPTVTLSFIGDNSMVYLIEYDSTEDMYDTRKYPFVVYEQFIRSKKLVKVHLKHFQSLYLNKTPSCQDITWILHMTRCGSTAVVQALNTVPNMSVISEPMYQHRYLIGKTKTNPDLERLYESEDIQNMQRASVNYLLKDFHNEDKVTLKMTGSFEYHTLLPVLVKYYQHHKIIHMYRDGKATADSMTRGFGSLVNNILKVTTFMSKHFGMLEGPRQDYKVSFTVGMVKDEEEMMKSKYDYDVFFMMYLLWIGNVVHYEKHAGKIKHLHQILYEDLRADSEQVLRQVYEFLGIPVKHISVALEALREDSQKNTPLARDQISRKNWKRDERIVDMCEKVLAKYNLPPFDAKVRFTDERKLRAID